MIKKETVKSLVANKKAAGMTNEEIEQEFKAALQIRMINIDVYAVAMEEIYKD